MTTRKPRRKKVEPPNVIRTHSLTPSDVDTLERLAQDAGDALGWTVSSSAIVRALVRYVGKQGADWRQEELFPLVEAEIQSGVVWGSRMK
jgi:hypothetical protein